MSRITHTPFNMRYPDPELPKADAADLSPKAIYEAGRKAERERILGLEVMKDEEVDSFSSNGSQSIEPMFRNELRASLRKAIGDSDE